MQELADIFKLLSDKSRLRILMILDRRELCVCQVMGVLGISQPLVSRNLALLQKAGLITSRREGKMIFYRVTQRAGVPARQVLALLRGRLTGDASVEEDLRSLKDCEEFQKRTGACDMETYLAFMEKRKLRRAKKEKVRRAAS